MAADGVVRRPVDRDHRPERDVGGGAIAERRERATAHQRRHVAQDARLFADRRHPVPRLHRDQGRRICGHHCREVVEQRRSRADVGIEEHEDLLVRRLRPVPAGVRLAEPPVRWWWRDDDLGAQCPCDAPGSVRRMVVDHDDTITRALLVDQRAEQVREGVGLVAGRDDHRDRWSVARRRGGERPGAPEQQPPERPAHREDREVDGAVLDAEQLEPHGHVCRAAPHGAMRVRGGRGIEPTLPRRRPARVPFAKSARRPPRRALARRTRQHEGTA